MIIIRISTPQKLSAIQYLMVDHPFLDMHIYICLEAKIVCHNLLKLAKGVLLGSMVDLPLHDNILCACRTLCVHRNGGVCPLFNLK